MGTKAPLEMLLKALLMSRATSAKEGWVSRIAEMAWMAISEPFLQHPPTWQGNGPHLFVDEVLMRLSARWAAGNTLEPGGGSGGGTFGYKAAYDRSDGNRPQFAEGWAINIFPKGYETPH